MMALVPSQLTLAYLADPNSVHTHRWLGYFAERGHAVHLLTGADEVVKPGLPAGIALHRYARFGQRRLPMLSSLQGRRALRSVLRHIDPDVVHGHYLTRHGWQARLSGFHPYVISPWGSDLFVTPLGSLRARIWAGLTLRGADLVTVVSDQMREAVMAHGVRSDRIRMIQFGVDTERFRPADPDPTRLSRLGLGARRIIFSPRAVRPMYRPEVVVDAFGRLDDDDTALVLTTRSADPSMLARVRERLVALGIGDRVRLLDDVKDGEMLDLFQQAEVTISVPESDAIPISVLEAMSCGRPVIASDLPGLRELLGPTDPGLLVPIDDVDATTNALRRLLDRSATDRAALGASLRSHVITYADRQTNMERMEALYEALRAGKR